MNELLDGQTQNLAYYCKCFNTLHVNNNNSISGRSPHKPILILAVIELINRGLIANNKILVSDELIELFNQLFDIFIDSKYVHRKTIYYPFFSLRNECFWHLNHESFSKGLQMRSIAQLRKTVDYAYLDENLFDLFQEPSTRQVLIATLIDYLSDSQAKVAKPLDINENFEKIDRYELENFDSKVKYTLRKSPIRNYSFRTAVVDAYNHRCAFCKLRITRHLSQNIIDCAHIKPYANFLDSKIDNALSLCKNHHWAFDLGWFSIDDNYRILVAQDLDDDSPHTRAMKEFDHELIALPSDKRYFPRLESLKWHRENTFQP